MEKLYYISQGKTIGEHLQNIENVCKGGVKLIQLRLKNISDEKYLQTGRKAKEICQKYDAILIINDNIDVAKKLKLGVHLGKDDESISKAKQVLKQGLIGGTANTIEDCLKLIHQRVDYIGLGPFKFTETKRKLSPILGLEGYKDIISDLKSKGYDIPIYAIGGIIENDIDTLLFTGVHGIAVSGLLTKSEELTISAIQNRLKS